jgi:hypothetical protein
MNMEENPSLWQYLEFPKICPLNTYQKLTCKGLRMKSNEKVINMKFVGNFKPYDWLPS